MHISFEQEYDTSTELLIKSGTLVNAHVQSKNASSDFLARLIFKQFQMRILQMLCFICNMHTYNRIKMYPGFVVFSSSSACNVYNHSVT